MGQCFVSRSVTEGHDVVVFFFFSLCPFLFSKATTATQDPIETFEKVIVPLCKVPVDFHLGNGYAEFQLCCCRRTLESPRICHKWQLQLILGKGKG